MQRSAAPQNGQATGITSPPTDSLLVHDSESLLFHLSKETCGGPAPQRAWFPRAGIRAGTASKRRVCLQHVRPL